MDLGATSSPPPSLWSRLSYDLAELILSRLPLRSLVRASAVCRQWRSLMSDLDFWTRTRTNPWFFLYGQNNIFLKKNQAYGFDPDSNNWIRLPDNPINDACFSGAGGFAFSTGPATRFRYSPLLGGGVHGERETSPLFFSRLNPLVGVFSGSKIIVVGGARFIGGLVDIEDRLAVEIYDPAADSWELGPPLPAEFRSENSSQWLCSALLLDQFFFVLGIFSSTLSAFDLVTKSWGAVRVLHPPGVLFSFLIACRDRLILAGLCNTKFVLWVVDHKSLEYRKIGSMPRDLMASLFDSEVDDAKFASLKCVGLDGLVYVFNEDHHKGYPACVCEIADDLDCTWKKVPPLPGPVNLFHKVIAFCSAVPLQSVFGRAQSLRGKE